MIQLICYIINYSKSETPVTNSAQNTKGIHGMYYYNNQQLCNRDRKHTSM